MKNKLKDIFSQFKISKDTFHSSHMKHGSYSVAVTVLVIAIAVIINLVVNALPSTYTTFDLSDTQLLSISDQTEEIVEGLQEDVTIYLVAQDGNEDTTVKQLLERYEALSSHVNIVYKDPVLYPNFTSQFDASDLAENSLIIESDKRYKTVDYSDIYVSSYDYTTYAQSTEFDGEGQLTSAIDYVVSDDLPVLYTLTGHNETSITSSLQSSIEKDNIDIEDLSLLTEESVPDDANCLFIIAPQSDLSSDEKDKILEYINAGGNVFLITAYLDTELPNLEEVIAAYGLETVDGVVVEGDANYYANPYSNYLVPEIQSHTATSALVSGNMHVLIPNAQGIQQIEDENDALEITSLLTTSDSSYSKVNVNENTTAEKEDGDIDGPFDLAAAVTNSIDDDTQSNFIYVSSPYLLDENLDSMVSGGNSEFIINCLGWLCEHESSITIHAKSMDSETLVLTAAQSNSISIFLMVIVPLAIIIVGLVIWLRRRKK